LFLLGFEYNNPLDISISKKGFVSGISICIHVDIEWQNLAAMVG
jgi:hypothetical protein